MNKSTTQIAEELSKKFPGIKGICNADAFLNETKSGVIHLGDACEGGVIGDMSAANYYSEDIEETTYIMGIHKKLVAALEEYDYFAEFRDAGTLLAYKI